MNVAIPVETSALADSLTAGSRRVSTALSGVGLTTETALDATEETLAAVIADARVLQLHVRGLKARLRRERRVAA